MVLETGAQTPRSTGIPDDPDTRLGFEINAPESFWSFTPYYYPEVLRMTKDRELNRDGRQCGGENVALKGVKNLEPHISGIILGNEIASFHFVQEHEDVIDLITPKAPTGGVECHIKNTELGEEVGWDPIEKQRRFEYSIDLVSTGRDEYESGDNGIVSEILSSADNPSDDTGTGIR